jgi:hypothetical protein
LGISHGKVVAKCGGWHGVGPVAGGTACRWADLAGGWRALGERHGPWGTAGAGRREADVRMVERPRCPSVARTSDTSRPSEGRPRRGLPSAPASAGRDRPRRTWTAVGSARLGHYPWEIGVGSDGARNARVRARKS